MESKEIRGQTAWYRRAIWFEPLPRTPCIVDILLEKYKERPGAQIHLILALCSTGWRLAQVVLANGMTNGSVCLDVSCRAYMGWKIVRVLFSLSAAVER